MELNDQVVNSMAIGAAFKDYNGKISSLDFHRTEDFLVTASDDESIRLYNTSNATLVKTVYSKKYGVDQICFTHHANCVVYSSKNIWDESLRYLSLYDNRYLRYYKGHRDKITSLCMSPKNDSFMSSSLDNTIRLWDLRSSNCQGLMNVKSRSCVSYDQQGLVFIIFSEKKYLKLFDIRSYDKGPFDTFVIDDNNFDINTIKFSNDGKLLLLSNSNQIYVLDAYSGQKLKTFYVIPDAEGNCLEASFSPDANYVLSGSGDGSLNAWHVSSGVQVASWNNLGGVPSAVKWAPRRMMFAAASNLLTLFIPDLTKLNSI